MLQANDSCWMSVVGTGAKSTIPPGAPTAPASRAKSSKTVSQFPIEIVDATLDLTRAAAELRANHKLPYSDCFAAALAAHRKASLATSDQDFAIVEKKIDILWTIHS